MGYNWQFLFSSWFDNMHQEHAIGDRDRQAVFGHFLQKTFTNFKTKIVAEIQGIILT